ncbi:FAD/NAD(P)-binding protein [Nocardioides sp. R-C-SC26]|uniref:FAD/NAD(P)-binding protein n=1 Tax=Nocardioides sp. R-C-SC26 TaxID=2870414 RepID=UPI001E35F605|nr:FAD/NAD(P)-binding protein [Nocardioides sp. R-C-SC26]
MSRSPNMTPCGTAAHPTVIVVGGGAGGALTALHLTVAAGRRSTRVDVVVVDPLTRIGSGTAFGTPDEDHLLNVPAAGMSALPEDPGHFVAWRRRTSPTTARPYEFAPRRDYARYLDETLRTATAESGDVTITHVPRIAVGVDPDGSGVRVRLDDGSAVRGDALVVAPGLPAPASEWAPTDLAGSAFYVSDPWATGALDVVARDRVGPGEVLVVGTGLTAVDVALTLVRSSREDRVVHAISRSGRLPHPHAEAMLPPATPDISGWGTPLVELRQHVSRHLRQVTDDGGDWRSAVDGLRFQIGTLWGRLSEPEREEFLTTDAASWNRLRHRMAPASRRRMESLVAEGRVQLAAASVSGASPLPRGGLRVELTDGTTRDVGWVINATGPRHDVRVLGNPLIDDLLRRRPDGRCLAVPATAGMGVLTHDGRVSDSAGRPGLPIWAIGALRRGELWESTAVPEIRSQALAAATAVLDAVAPMPRRLADGRVVSGHHPIARPRDPLGLPISTTAEAALAFNAGLEQMMRVQDGAAERFAEAAALDPGFALAYAALALLGHEAGAQTDVVSCLAAAVSAIATRGDDRERSLVEVVRTRIEDARPAGDAALLSHVAAYPRDVLAVSAAVPTIAFSGVTDVRREAWDLVEGLAPAYGDHWWYLSLLAFTRQDQGRFEEAGLLAESALACEPASGHAAHALAHVLYETGQHETGKVWLDHWIAENGRSANHRAHFSWHAALHELAAGDTESVRHRYYAELAPPTVTGVRALIDAASLLWRWRVTTSICWGLDGDPVPPVDPVLAAVDADLLDAPESPFTAVHAAIALTTAGQVDRLRGLADHVRSSPDAVLSTTVAAICDGLVLVATEDFAAAADVLMEVMPRLEEVGGSAAQREVIEETLLYCLRRSDQVDPVRGILSDRLSRRHSPLDDARRIAV